MTRHERVLSEQVLSTRLEPNDAGAETVKDYLLALLEQVWVENEGFSGKRPFGNSGWESDIYVALIKAGLVPGTLDEHDYIDEIDTVKADNLIVQAIREL
jgi:hypothetical protein